MEISQLTSKSQENQRDFRERERERERGKTVFNGKERYVSPNIC
jgi:hypothetical protein